MMRVRGVPARSGAAGWTAGRVGRWGVAVVATLLLGGVLAACTPPTHAGPRRHSADRYYQLAAPVPVDSSTAPAPPSGPLGEFETELPIPTDAGVLPSRAGQPRPSLITDQSATGGRVRGSAPLAHASVVAGSASPLEAAVGFQGMAQGGTPPDLQVAAGNGFVVEQVNAAMAVYDRTGQNTTCVKSLQAVYGLGTTPLTDPKIFFDQSSGKFVAAIISRQVTNTVYLAVSQTTSPCGNWWVWPLTAEAGQVLDDQPRIGFSNDKIMLAFDQFDVADPTNLNSPGNTFNHEYLYVIDKAAAVAGSTPQVAEFNMSNVAKSRFGLTPAIPLPGAATAAGFAMYHRNPAVGATKAWTVVVTGSPSAKSVTWSESDAAIGDYNRAPAASQPNTSTTLDAGDGRYSAVQQYSSGGGTVAGLWAASGDGCTISGVGLDCIRMTQVTVDGSATSSLASDVDLGHAGVDFYNGGILGDCAGNQVMVSYTRSSGSEYPTAEIDGLTTPQVLGGGQWGHSTAQFGTGTVPYGGFANQGVQRWGDYSVLSAEDSCGDDAWAVAQYGGNSAAQSFSTNPPINGGYQTAIAEFTFNEPAVSLVLPSSGSPTTVVDITGSGFTSSSFVAFGAVPATSVTFLGSDHLRAVAPPHAMGTVDVTVTTQLGTSLSHFSDHFTYPAMAWVATTGNGVVDVFNLSSNKLSRRMFDLSGRPQKSIAVAPDGAMAYLTSGASPFLYAFSGSDYGLAQSIGLNSPPPAVVPRVADYVAVSPDGAFAYVTSTAAGVLDVVDLATNTDVAEIPVSPSPAQIALSPDGTRAYVTDHSINAVLVVDLDTRGVAAAIPIVGAQSIASGGSTVWVGTGGLPGQPNSVVPVDTTTNPATVGAPIPVEPTPVNLTTTPDGAWVYASNSNTNIISVIHRTGPSSGTFTAAVPALSGPAGLAATPDGTTIAAALSGSSELMSLASPANALNGSFLIDATPVWVAIAQRPTRACSPTTGVSKLRSSVSPPTALGYIGGTVITRIDDIYGCSATGGPQAATITTSTTAVNPSSCPAPPTSSYDVTLQTGENAHFLPITTPTCAATYSTLVQVGIGGFVVASSTISYTTN